MHYIVPLIYFDTYIALILCTCQCDVPGWEGWTTLGVLMKDIKDISPALGILTWPCWPWGILTLNCVPDIDVDLGECGWFWHPTMPHGGDSETIFCLCQNPHDLLIFPTHHIDLCNTLHKVYSILLHCCHDVYIYFVIHYHLLGTLNIYFY